MADAPALPLAPDENAHIPMMALDEWMRAYDRQSFELVDGERIPLAATVFRHFSKSSDLKFELDVFVRTHQLGVVYAEVPFVVTYSRNWVKGSRTPDIMFVSAARFYQYIATEPNYEEKPLVLVPDLAVEIISPTDKEVDVKKKAKDYLRDGVQLVWVIYPKDKTIAVYQHGSNLVQLLGADDTLTGGAVLPGFSVKIGDIL